jgi:RNA polymerase sigma factor (TIGR02999 family)
LLDIERQNEGSCFTALSLFPHGGLVDSQVALPVPSRTEPLFQTLYVELHRLARCELARRGSDLSIGVTSLLHEAWLNMAAHREQVSFPDRARFMAYAAQVMRRLIVDYARDRHTLKRGGAFEITSLDTKDIENLANAAELEKISEALDELAEVDRPLAEIVDMKFFCGFTLEEIAEIRGLSERTVRRNWEKARLYLYQSISSDLSV